jgi:predicted DNA-binding transcriptional regulator AlpA
MDLPTRIRPAEVARITSLSVRQIQAMAAAGKIPGAARLGGVWSFDLAKIDAWVRAAEREAIRQDYKFTTREVLSPQNKSSIPPDQSIDAAYQRLLHRRPESARRTHG